MEEYVLNRQNKVVQYIVMRPILDLWEETVRMLGKWVEKRWWEQEGLDMAGARAAAEMSVEEDRGGGYTGIEEAE